MKNIVTSGWTHSLFGQLTIATLWLLIVGLCATIVNHFNPDRNELVRKVIHIGTGNIILIAWWLNIPMWIIIAASIFFSILTLLSYYFPILPNINSIGRKSFGTFFYAVSIGVLAAWFWTVGKPEFAAIGILVMTWGDGFAALIGQRFGKHSYRLWDMKKSWEGSSAMAAISFSVCALILLSTIGNVWQIWLVSLLVGLCAAGLEAFSKFGIDNLTVPIMSAAIAFFLTQNLL
ncbi:diacylglycerol/polyprenol kinase family protein [Leptolyngbya sp. GGD]|uniref:diacylglycerol/polyprenol kinase family protein n=1 Tax=Leptolyngbya sp. GGD TaxID=2997907 RepID=UPI0018EF6F5E|nr:diacylglycerol/polyprenol kinase family protein [Leptolyngbya sp. GGD]MCY6491292.1 SEC59/DGK1/VTE5 family protein [Leptolyngbya sp. GGD]BAS58602.1 phosphatidate cytidylyltransferase [Leptolyngbya boryana IAM M-101]BAS64950.1 phosphatidate cytidylyltransferase [Leptolyngbya boryana dg5]